MKEKIRLTVKIITTNSDKKIVIMQDIIGQSILYPIISCIIFKLNEKLNSLDKKIVITEESSKCNSLNLKKLRRKDSYDDEKKNRDSFIPIIKSLMLI